MPDQTVTTQNQWGTPSDEEMAAIIAAIELASSASPPVGTAEDDVARWRFSGRWWSKPIPVRRDRP
jgi:hypothetical protein